MNKIEPRGAASYEVDFALWAAEQATLVRAGRLDRLDTENVAEELESIGREERRKIDAHLNALLLQMLRWYYQPEYRCGKWKGELLTYRSRIADILEDSPSLASHVSEAVEDEYRIARRWSSIETTVFLDLIPEACPWTAQQILDPEFLPGGS